LTLQPATIESLDPRLVPELLRRMIDLLERVIEAAPEDAIADDGTQETE
jgi:hypothetical protein